MYAIVWLCSLPLPCEIQCLGLHQCHSGLTLHIPGVATVQEGGVYRSHAERPRDGHEACHGRRVVRERSLAAWVHFDQHASAVTGEVVVGDSGAGALPGAPVHTKSRTPQRSQFPPSVPSINCIEPHVSKVRIRWDSWKQILKRAKTLSLPSKLNAILNLSENPTCAKNRSGPIWSSRSCRRTGIKLPSPTWR